MLHEIAPHVYQVPWQNTSPKPSDVLCCIAQGRLLCRMTEGQLSLLTVRELSPLLPSTIVPRYLFAVDGVSFFDLPADSSKDFPLPANCLWLSRRDCRNLQPQHLAFGGITALHLHQWYGSHQFCGACGSAMIHHSQERAMVCPRCRQLYYPQICPSVIVGVTRGDSLLLTRYAQGRSAYRNWALVAGFCEIGESLEDTVRREVLEETGLSVTNLRYWASQPWSMTGTLLAGFFCDAPSGDIAMDETELSDARWFGRREIPEDAANAAVSLTGAMMAAFRDGRV